MSPENTSDLEQEPAPMSEVSRLTGVFFEPGKTFADIAERPRWFWPLLIVVLGAVVFYALVSTHVGFRGMVEEQFNTPRAQQQMAQMSPEQRQRTMTMYEKAYPIAFTAGSAAGIPIMYLLSALVVWGMASGIMSAGLRFKQVFAITCYASLTSLVTRVLATVVMFLKQPDQYNIMNPVASNPAAFMDQATASKFLYALASGLDVIAIWAMFLMAVGIKAAAGKRLSFGGALFSVLLPWGVLTLLGAMAAGMFS
jgi:hypothetical protein